MSHRHNHSEHCTQHNATRIKWVLIITATYAVIQIVGGWLSGSLALIADSVHMFSDSAALLLALVAYRISRRKPDVKRSYGYDRVRVLAALANGSVLLAITAWIIVEAISRALNPLPILATPMLIVACIGLLINLIGAFVLHGGHQHDQNLRGAFLHVLGDLLGSVGAIAAAIGIMYTGWTLLDPLLSVFVALLIVHAAWRLVVDAVQVLLQASPTNVDAPTIEHAVQQLDGVAQAGHLHVWTLTDNVMVATLHVTPKAGVDPLTLPAHVSHYLREHWGFTHITVQVDPPDGLTVH